MDSETRYSIIEIQRRLDMLENEIKRLRSHNPPTKSDSTFEATTTGGNANRVFADDLRNTLLGRLTTILIKKHYFPSNKKLVDFVEKELSLHIPNWDKKSRPEIIGITIEKMYYTDPRKIRQFYMAASAFKRKEKEGKIDNFYEAWEKTIRELKFRGE